MSFRGTGFGAQHPNNEINAGFGSSRSAFNSSRGGRGSFGGFGRYRDSGDQSTLENSGTQVLGANSVSAEEQARLDDWNSMPATSKCPFTVALETREASIQIETKKKIDMGFFAMAGKQFDQVPSAVQKVVYPQSCDVPVSETAPPTQIRFTRPQMIECSMSSEAKKVPMIGKDFDKILRGAVTVKSVRTKPLASVPAQDSFGANEKQSKKVTEKANVNISSGAGMKLSLPKDLLKEIGATAGTFSEAFSRLEIFLQNLIQ
uniref:Uncharacterized protein n=1 Tax=Ditylenchus dipsaci TaxID=166011 RepID=A0A915CVJ4_9BILA